ncbi:MAG: Gfo/Idh/MocA family oxidoreductase [Planctomycetes bacterium]|nr:Gfo/Idh/MocA family oxidoreductase [Planctomycetota bacterium]
MPESNTGPVPLALVGCGAIAAAYVQALSRVPTLRLAAVVDPSPAARDAFSTRHALPAFADVAELVARGPAIVAAIVATPPDTHESLSCGLLEAGAHVLCEKPFAPTVAAAERMLATARRCARRLMLASKFRYTPDVTAARHLLDDGVCGDLVLYENVFCSHVDMTSRWNAQAERSGGGVLIDNGCHSVDLARYLLGPIARVQAQFGRRVQPIDVEDTARLLFTSAAGALGSIDLSWSVHKETPAYVRIHGTRGTIEVGWQSSRWKSAGGAWTAFGGGYDKIGAFAAQLANFAGCITGREAAVIGDADALASVVVVDCAYRAAADERWIVVPDDPPLA